MMIERGINSTVLADVMGHRDSRTTERMYIDPVNGTGEPTITYMPRCSSMNP
jgi:hypothetical protein